MQKMADEWATAFNRGAAATVAQFYKTDGTVFPPGSDMIKGRQNIEAFWKKASDGIGEINFQVLDVESLGPNAAREQGAATCVPREPVHRNLPESMLWSGKK